jgi:CheY-like chemotaxis protein
MQLVNSPVAFAHDFNNMLGGILMSAGLLNKYIGNIPEAQRPLKLICDSAKHAAALTQKLLTFSRKENKSTTNIDLHSVVKETASLLETTIDKRIVLTLKLSAENASILGDDSSLQSCILNLGINASHAMQNGGEIIFTTKTIYLDENFCSKNTFNLKTGLYIQLDVKDSGHGIAPENLPKIFEPFFTTKPLGQGTGLGLSTVYGTIQQHHGAISVSSIVNEGTTFHILLPIYQGNSDLFKNNEEYFPKKGEGLILFVDDESVFRDTVKEILEDMGYQVLTAINGSDALQTYERFYYKIDLVILDMMMPVMNGLDSYICMKKINPNVRAILATGYIKDSDLEKIKSEGINDLINKPYDNNELFQKIEAILRQI